VSPDQPQPPEGAAAIARLTPGRGVLFLIVGQSGAGKDTLITWLRERRADHSILYVRRTVTRAADGGFEDHGTMDRAAFARAEAAGAFTAVWNAHGLHYGLPIDLRRHLADGGVAIANGSRQALPTLRRQLQNMVVVHLQVAPDELARRLSTRGRESPSEITTRLSRGAHTGDWSDDTIHLDNSDAVHVAG